MLVFRVCYIDAETSTDLQTTTTAAESTTTESVTTTATTGSLVFAESYWVG